MDENIRAELIALGERLALACPDKLKDIIIRLREVVDAQEIIASFENQLFLRGLARKRHLA